MQLTQKQKEWFFITLAWVLIYVSTPLYIYYGQLVLDTEFIWAEVLDIWFYNSAFLIIFFLNHFVLIPQLINKKRIWQYCVCVVGIMMLFIWFLHSNAPVMRFNPEHGDFYGNVMPTRPEHLDQGPFPFAPTGTNQRSRFLVAPPDLARIIIALLMLGVDLGVVAWFNQQKMQQRLLLLEKQNLKQELDHLHYQINPHFFMNTLNNIHALVDIDQTRAKRAIVELSSLMRYSLYEGNSVLVSAAHEAEFIRLYISLMKLRYSDKVEIVCTMPEQIPAEILMPPLLLATFVENAFKHGVSYQEKSFIYTYLSVDSDNNKITFQCINSQHNYASVTKDGHHGIGLDNVRKRLDLQYGDSYTLLLDDSNAKQFSVELTLPVKQKEA